MLTVYAPDVCRNEIDYTLSVVFNDRLKIEYTRIWTKSKKFKLLYEDESKSIELDATFFLEASKSWLETDLKTILIDEFYQGMPVYFGENAVILNKTETSVGFDIFGTIFFLLSRYEEVVNRERDAHGRFSSRFSKVDCSKPIVDLYIQYLISALSDHFNVSVNDNVEKHLNVTCDVDFPFTPFLYDSKKLIIEIARLILKKRRFKLAYSYLKSYISSLFLDGVRDPFFDGLNWVMDVNEECGNQVTFYFLVDSSTKFDVNLKDNDELFKLAIKTVHSRGHKIALHPGYSTYNNEDLFSKGLKRLMREVSSLGIESSITSSRQHYLKWCALKTPSILDSQGIKEDSTLGYADSPGFRCGTSHPFYLYDLLNRKKTDVKERPLVLMESTFYDSVYGFKSDELEEYSKELYAESKKFCGAFTLLWHNSSLVTHQDKGRYKELIFGLSGAD